MGEDQGLLIAPLVGQAGNPDQPCRFVLSEALQPLGDAQRLFVAVLPAAGQRQFRQFAYQWSVHVQIFCRMPCIRSRSARVTVELML